MDGAWDAAFVHFIFGAHVHKQEVFIVLHESFQIAIGDMFI